MKYYCRHCQERLVEGPIGYGWKRLSNSPYSDSWICSKSEDGNHEPR